VGRAAVFRERIALSMDDLGRNARDFVLDGDWMPDYLATKYADLTDELLETVEARARNWGGARVGRILGTVIEAISCGPIWGAFRGS